MSAHAPNQIASHKARCRGKLTMKPNVKSFGTFELWTCSKPECNYTGRGAEIVAPKPKAEEPKKKKHSK